MLARNKPGVSLVQETDNLVEAEHLLNAQLSAVSKCATLKKKHIYPCPMCNKVFFHYYNLNRHLISHSVERPHICEFCNKSFKDVNVLNLHLRIHDGKFPYICQFCEKGFNTLKQLCEHILNHTAPKSLRCKICQEEFSDLNELKVHRQVHIDKFPHVCKNCNQGYSHANTLRMHSCPYKSVWRFVCEVCNKRFSQKGTFERHQITHTSERPYTCKTCDKPCPSLVGLKSHSQLHIRRPHLCSICKSCFKDLNSLYNHVKMHLGILPFVCKLCDKAFPQKISLENHYMVHLKQLSSKESDLYVCGVCNKSFMEKEHLEAHKYTHLNLGQPLFRCEICRECFIFESNFRQHAKLHGIYRPHVCEICSMRFVAHSSLKRHFSKHNSVEPCKTNKNCNQSSQKLEIGNGESLIGKTNETKTSCTVDKNRDTKKLDFLKTEILKENKEMSDVRRDDLYPRNCDNSLTNDLASTPLFNLKVCDQFSLLKNAISNETSSNDAKHAPIKAQVITKNKKMCLVVADKDFHALKNSMIPLTDGLSSMNELALNVCDESSLLTNALKPTDELTFDHQVSNKKSWPNKNLKTTCNQQVMHRQRLRKRKFVKRSDEKSPNKSDVVSLKTNFTKPTDASTSNNQVSNVPIIIQNNPNPAGGIFLVPTLNQQVPNQPVLLPNTTPKPTDHQVSSMPILYQGNSSAAGGFFIVPTLTQQSPHQPLLLQNTSAKPGMSTAKQQISTLPVTLQNNSSPSGTFFVVPSFNHPAPSQAILLQNTPSKPAAEQLHMPTINPSASYKNSLLTSDSKQPALKYNLKSGSISTNVVSSQNVPPKGCDELPSASNSGSFINQPTFLINNLMQPPIILLSNNNPSNVTVLPTISKTEPNFSNEMHSSEVLCAADDLSSVSTSSSETEGTGRKTFKATSLKARKTLYSEIKPKVCHFCKKTFRFQKSLASHLLTHNKEYSVKDLNSHENFNPANIETRYVCGVCNRVFSHMNLLEAHMCSSQPSCEIRKKDFVNCLEDKKSTTETSNICFICSQVFVDRADLKKHLKVHIS